MIQIRTSIQLYAKKIYFYLFPFTGGAGGKGTWGKICEVYPDGDGDYLDPNDPNYDSDNMENCKIEAITPVLDEDQIEQYVKPIVTEYYEHGNTEEVIDSLQEFNFGDELYMIAVIAISLAMERKNANREMTSVLISDLYGHVFQQKDIEHAFDVLLEMLPDLMLDTPNADELLGNFIARAVADDCIPPIYVKRNKEKYTEKPQKFSIEVAHDLLTSKHGLINVDLIWGFTGGMRPVKYLIKQMHLILEEYLVSNLATDAGSNLNDLEVPHFHHEFVYEAIVKAIEDSKETTIDKICALLKYLFDSGVITIDQLKNVMFFLQMFFPVYSNNICLIVDTYRAIYVFLKRCQILSLMYRLHMKYLKRSKPKRKNWNHFQMNWKKKCHKGN